MKQKLKSNEEKTEFIVFGTRRQLKTFSARWGYYLEIKHSKKSGSVGVVMDQYLDMRSHVASVYNVCYHLLEINMEHSPVYQQRGYENLGSCNDYVKVGLLQLISIWNKSVPHSKASKSSKCSC